MTERRHRKDRRRRQQRNQRRDRIAIIEIAQSDLHAVLLSRHPGEGPDGVETSTVRWRHEAPSLYSETGRKELTAGFLELAELHELQGARLQIVLSGEFCVTRTFHGSIDQVRSELRELEQRSRLYLSLGPGEKVVVSNTQSLDARHQRAVAAVCNEDTLESIRLAAAEAETKIESIEPALVSISRAIGRLENAPEKPSLLLNLDQTTIEIGVCHQGQLLLDYRPGGRSAVDGLVELVEHHQGRLERHCGRQLGEASPSLELIYLCGDPSAIEAAEAEFGESSGFQLKHIHPNAIRGTWKLEQKLDQSISIPALGGLLATYLPPDRRDAPDFVEHLLARTREPVRKVLLRSAAPLAAVLLVALSLGLVNGSGRRSVASLEAEVGILAPDLVRARELRLKLLATDSKLLQMEKLASQLQAVPAHEVVRRLAHCMPDDVWLRNLELVDMQTIQLAGTSFLQQGVHDFVQWLEEAPGFTEVALQGTQRSGSTAQTIDFDVKLNLSDSGSEVKEVARNE